MTNEERDLIARYISRVAGAAQAQSFGAPGSVPASQPALPPIDREADTYINQLFQQYPEARYRITQTALVQEAALAESQNRVRQLEWELQQAQHAVQQAQQAQPQQNKGFFGSLFGGGSQQQPQRPQGAWGGQGGMQGGYGQPMSGPPQPQYPPGYQPGMFQQQGRGGSGFLGTALTTAAGVAGGMVLGNALMGAFSGGGASQLASAGGSAFDGAGAANVSDPTGGLATDAGFGGAAVDPFAGGGMEKGAYDNGGDAGVFDGGGGDFDAGGFDDNV